MHVIILFVVHARTRMGWFLFAYETNNSSPLNERQIVLQCNTFFYWCKM